MKKPHIRTMKKQAASSGASRVRFDLTVCFPSGATLQVLSSRAQTIDEARREINQALDSGERHPSSSGKETA